MNAGRMRGVAIAVVLVALLASAASSRAADAATEYDAVLVHTFRPEGEMVPGHYSFCGSAVAIHGDLVVIGAPPRCYVFDLSGELRYTIVEGQIGSNVVATDGYALSSGYKGQGPVILFNLETGETKEVRPPPGREILGFGTSLAACGGEFLVGSPQDDGDGRVQGAAFLYDLDGECIRAYSLTNEPRYAMFGAEVALSDGLVALWGGGSDLLDSTYAMDFGLARAEEAFPPGSRSLAFLDRDTGRLKRLVRGLDEFAPDTRLLASSGIGIVWSSSKGIFFAAAPDAADVHSLELPHLPGATHSRLSSASDGKRIAVGYIGFRDESSQAHGGIVRLYDSATGSILETIISPDQSPEARFGAAVALHDRHLLVGSPVTGAAFLYEIRPVTSAAGEGAR